jgi:CubicO group peptidase (beta-lactamase class C family)
MKPVTLACLSFFLILLIPAPVGAQENAERLDAMIRQGMEDWHIPGLAAIVVKDGEVAFSQVYGVKDLGTGAVVDRETLFNMGSTTKAVVSMALGILVDQGKLKWEDKVRDHLPPFRLSDPYITEEARVQDLLTHNLGIAGADGLWAMDSVSTEATLRRFALSRKAYPVRGGFQYNNLMYAVAGEVIEAVSGRHWTDFVKEHLFGPLEMDRTVARATDIFSAGNYVTPYFYENGVGHIAASHDLSDQIGAAGMIWTCAADMEHYLQMLEAGGEYKGKTLLKPETFAYLFRPHTLIPENSFYPTRQLTRPNWMSYALGWFQHDYRGHKLDFHTGSISGLVAIAGIMHNKNTAVYVLANRDHAELRHAILYQALDLWAFGEASRDWHQEVFELYEGIRKASENRELEFSKQRVKDTRPTLPLAAYEGTYHHPMLGDVFVRQSPGGLQFDFNHFTTFEAGHWHYNSFRSTRENRYRAEVLFTFHLGPAGTVSELEAMGEGFKKQ